MTFTAPAATLHAYRIHPSAIVEDGAKIGLNVEIGPFCHIGPKVKLGDNVRVMSHVVIDGTTTIGEGTIIYPNAVLGCAPQNIHYKGEDTELIIGRGCTIREGVTMHPGMPDFGGQTTVGDNSMFLAYSHVAHDCHVGSNVILSNNVMLAGHVTIGDRVIMGGGAAVHQFTRIGHHAFIGGLAAVSNDVIPYGMLNGNPGVLMGLNIIGMQRSGFDKPAIHAVRRAYKMIFDPATPIRQNITHVREMAETNAAVADIVAFIDAESERALSSPARGQRG
ncbi:MAG: acyl-ACP--UDP-N-acetylglucosamine O-acyltransferase [Hoeflea sp.]|uniref:acyl-ACP--UDP-N-acetylglucosamine O-acyltransferase n=1 Tax=Hoeflea sp. TaxID=1940281 RepID=UPI001D32E919|nr:acyl-ACP--UDP-N-acetylglucosamine O-acyltransferase [Hoeflea sp.]MBU4529644.1 acyl-ACP--UDP-N-acetylglucosamine O-acyltransferase [Alphaproteobacteria bacterium]MBU4546763.1 acyl-ACP--UDP-N-acetylglucosamine O-acyltransferase [Alphaproteobacteria bacterium]MBU4551031.1 acyl-ACP--UDP-N-acetylglucosamine O-acyltransferase [Alphaproteobacteria bacterium]MBV1723973.1 acyl-ACP--UDP-N-acetylglucosamine O-acyltransferase [Hoeflea sp.]MBV1763250.1 acyl-ACP--UDP-N-acetylglucosamine O-acyltransferase